MIESFVYKETPWSPTRQGGTEAEMQARFAERFPGIGMKEGVMGAGWPVDGQSLNADMHRQSEMAGVDGATPGISGLLSSLNGNEELTRLVALECRSAEERGFRRGIEQGLAQGEEHGRNQGRTQGLSQSIAQAREEAASQLQTERDQVSAQARALLESFTESREQYLHNLEQEAVRLALAIAARVLRREAQMDPLLLTGAVRVALRQLAEMTTVRLRVPAQDQPLWQEALAHIPGLALRPEVIGEPCMELGECRMETELGSADLGLWGQLKEIERGFFDRVGERVGVTGGLDSEPMFPLPGEPQQAIREGSMKRPTGTESWINEAAEVSR